MPSPNTLTRQSAEGTFRHEGLQLQVHLETNYLETIKMMVSIGLGGSVLLRHCWGCWQGRPTEPGREIAERHLH